MSVITPFGRPAVAFATIAFVLLPALSLGTPRGERKNLPSTATKTTPASAAAPSTTSVHPPATETPPKVAEATRLAIEGAYAVEGRAAEVRVRRLLGDIYHLTSSDGWEGVGILEGAVYRGVFRHRGAQDALDGAMGQQTIDWTTPENPSVQVAYVTLQVGQLVQRWRRISDPGPRATPRPLRPAHPSEPAATPGRRPSFGEYVYAEELPEAVTKVAPVYPPDVKAEGTVMLQALVLEDGSVGDVQVVNSIPELDAAAIASVRQWRFKPAMTKGVPVAVWVSVPIRFSRH